MVMTATYRSDSKRRRTLLAVTGVLLLVVARGCSSGRDGADVSLPDDSLAAGGWSAPLPAKAAASDAVPGPAETRADMDGLARDEPILFLERCLARYDREVRGYCAELVKQERLAGKLGPVEHVEVVFRETPFSVRMDWTQGVGLAARLAYVQGCNADQLLVRGAGWRALAGVLARDPLSDDARQSSRYPITEFGIKAGSLSTLASWRAARKHGALDIRYGGVKCLPELHGRPCWELRRVGYRLPEVDGITGATFYFDTETWLQTGSVLTGADGRLIARYYFRDVVLNPEIGEAVFTREGLHHKTPARPKR